MSEKFVKPERKVIDPIPYLKSIVGNGLIKDLHDGEIICPTCQGTGWAISNNVYGLSDDPDKSAGHFPYKHQSIGGCPNCYNGVLKVCKYCGVTLTKKDYNHKCEGIRRENELKKSEAAANTLGKARKIEPDSDEAKTMNMYYSEFYGYNNGYFDDWDSFFDHWNSYYDDEEIYTRPEYVYGTYSQDISIDAANIVERATEDLHEDASDQISNTDIEELQDYLNKWCAKQTGTTTYWEDNKVAIRIPWEDYKK